MTSKRGRRGLLAASVVVFTVAVAVVVFVAANAEQAPPSPPPTMPASAAQTPPAAVPPLPEDLAAVGIFSDLATLTPAAGVRAYAVRYELWSDGAKKFRHLALPPGGVIRVTDDGDFEFPVGTTLAKTFADPRNGARIETRVLRKTRARWNYATYIWNDENTAAHRTDGTDVTLHHRLPGCAEDYVVPSRVACQQCHEGVRDTVIGFAAYQLDEAQLSALERDGGLSQPVARIAHRSIVAANPLEAEALGYLAANCAHCHNPWSTNFEGARLDLRPTKARAQLVDIPTFRLRHPEATQRVAAGSPEHSVLFRLFTRTFSGEHERPLRMPPIGNQLVDPHGVNVLAAWIRSLTPAGDPPSHTDAGQD